MTGSDEVARCVAGWFAVMVCIPEDLLEAWNSFAETNDTDFTMGELFRQALIDFLRSMGKLPDRRTA